MLRFNLFDEVPYKYVKKIKYEEHIFKDCWKLDLAIEVDIENIDSGTIFTFNLEGIEFKKNVLTNNDLIQMACEESIGEYGSDKYDNLRELIHNHFAKDNKKIINLLKAKKQKLLNIIESYHIS